MYGDIEGQSERYVCELYFMIDSIMKEHRMSAILFELDKMCLTARWK